MRSLMYAKLQSTCTALMVSSCCNALKNTTTKVLGTSKYQMENLAGRGMGKEGRGRPGLEGSMEGFCKEIQQDASGAPACPHRSQ